MERPSLKGLKDKSIVEYIESLENQLKVYNDSPYVASYLNLKRIVDQGNEQMGTIKIDILTDDGQKNYKAISKFALQLQEYGEQMEFFKSKMTSKEVEIVDGLVVKKSLGQKVGVAEQMALKEKDGKNTSI